MDGYVFHQNTFGPTADLRIVDAEGRLAWSGPLLLAGELLGRPQGFMTIPGSPVGLLALLDQAADGTPLVVLQGVGPVPAGPDDDRTVFLATVPLGATTDPAITADHAITLSGIGAWSGMVIKNDPGQPIIWIAFGLLISGLVLTFYFPRRRAWARLEGERIALALTADRYVDRDRELARLVGEVSRSTGASRLRGPTA